MRRSNSRSSRDICLPRSRERELDRARLKWMREQEERKKHEELKQKRIQEYEENRARELALAKKNCGSSKTKEERITKPSTEVLVMSEKFHSPSSRTRLFKGSEGMKISVSELKKYQVKIDRNIQTTEKTTQVEREIVDPEDLILKRREGEGARPIFERIELEPPEARLSEVEERRTVMAVSDNVKVDRSRSSRRRTASPSPSRHHSRSPPRRPSSRHDTRYYDERSDRSRDYRDQSSGRSRENRDRPRDYRSSRRCSQDRFGSHRSHRSDSRDRKFHSRGNDFPTHRDHREYTREDMRDRGMPPPHHYIEPMPVPFLYGSIARPILIDPMVGMRGPLPMPRGRMPMMPHIRPPFLPRGMMPPEVFRPNMHPNYRYARTF